MLASSGLNRKFYFGFMFDFLDEIIVLVTVRATSTYIDETGTRSPNYKFVIGQS